MKLYRVRIIYEKLFQKYSTSLYVVAETKTNAEWFATNRFKHKILRTNISELGESITFGNKLFTSKSKQIFGRIK